MSYLDLCKKNPDLVIVQTDREQLTARPVSETVWQADSVTVSCEEGAWNLSSPDLSVRRVLLRWQHSFGKDSLILNDHYERGYGDLEWRGFSAERILPWYFLMREDDLVNGYGVKTNPNAICLWQVTDSDISLYFDVRSLGGGVQLGGKTLCMAEIVTHEGTGGETAFEAAQKLCKAMCSNGIFADAPVYGGNNWYYAYGKSSEAEILADTDRIAKWSEGLSNRPFMVIDSCWQSGIVLSGAAGGPYLHGNPDFPDMAGLAARIKAKGVRPGIWCRPLLTTENVPEHWILRTIPNEGSVLDPTVPEALAHVGEDIKRISSWGYELIKHDFTTFDITGLWGFEMGFRITSETRRFADPSKTTAEAMKALYQVIFENAGNALIIGCNTVAHLITGYAQIQRTGDDTSGVDWERTRKMGINTLSHRMAQHNIFFTADADCVGLTQQVPWEMNRRWLDVLAKSSTALFVSADPKALTPEIEAELKEAFAFASRNTDLLIPVDWLHNTCPTEWSNGKSAFHYDWNLPDRFVFHDEDAKI